MGAPRSSVTMPVTANVSPFGGGGVGADGDGIPGAGGPAALSSVGLFALHPALQSVATNAVASARGRADFTVCSRVVFNLTLPI